MSWLSDKKISKTLISKFLFDFVYWETFRVLCCLLIFFKINFLEKFLSGIPSECQTVWIQIRPHDLSGLIWIQAVCKGYQQTTLVGKELTGAVKNTLASPPNEGCNICVSLEFLYGIWSWLDRKAVNTWKIIRQNYSQLALV